MITQEVRFVTIGGYRYLFSARSAGDSCDRCDHCGKSNQRGAKVWMNSYNDLYCDACVQAELEPAP
jgi:hypothetical protein